MTPAGNLPFHFLSGHTTPPQEWFFLKIPPAFTPWLVGENSENSLARPKSQNRKCPKKFTLAVRFFLSYCCWFGNPAFTSWYMVNFLLFTRVLAPSQVVFSPDFERTINSRSDNDLVENFLWWGHVSFLLSLFNLLGLGHWRVENVELLAVLKIVVQPVVLFLLKANGLRNLCWAWYV